MLLLLLLNIYVNLQVRGEHSVPLSKFSLSGQAHRGPFGVARQMCSQPPLR